MNCTCGAISDVLETRGKGATVRRRRLCENGHRFTTVEVRADLLPQGMRPPRLLSERQQVSQERVALAVKNLDMPLNDLAVLLGVSKDWARVIRFAARSQVEAAAGAAP